MCRLSPNCSYSFQFLQILSNCLKSSHIFWYSFRLSRVLRIFRVFFYFFEVFQILLNCFQFISNSPRFFSGSTVSRGSSQKISDSLGFFQISYSMEPLSYSLVFFEILPDFLLFSRIPFYSDVFRNLLNSIIYGFSRILSISPDSRTSFRNFSDSLIFSRIFKNWSDSLVLSRFLADYLILPDSLDSLVFIFYRTFLDSPVFF